MVRLRSRHGLPLLLLAGWAVPLPAQSATWALTNARIETVTRGVIERGTIIIRDGLITAVGAQVTVPAVAVVIDLGGRTVSPGLIDLTSTLGIPPAPTASATPGQGRGGPGAPGFQSDRMVAGELTGAVDALKASREAGVTTALVAPDRGMFRGQSALVNTRESLDAKAVVRSPVATHMGYEGVGRGGYPGSLMGVIAAQRQTLFDAARYGLLVARWDADPRGATRPEHDAKLEALVPAVQGKMPVFVDAGNENEIRRAVRLGEEHHLNLTIVGAVEAWRALDAIKTHQLVVAVNFPRPNQVTGWRYSAGIPNDPADSTGRQEAATKLIERNPAAVHAAGARYALASGGTRGAEFVSNLRKAIAAGLPADAALAGATIRAAEVAGVAGALGSIEAGKIANLVVSSGPLLSDSAQISMVFVDGARYEVATKAPARPNAARGAGGGAAGAAAPAAVAGAWVITTNSPQGAMESTLTVTQDGSGVTGTMASEMTGSSPIDNGRVQGHRLSWSVSLNFGGQSFDISYVGEVDGNRITGTVTAGEFGSFTFSGEKQP